MYYRKIAIDKQLVWFKTNLFISDINYIQTWIDIVYVRQNNGILNNDPINCVWLYSVLDKMILFPSPYDL